MSEVTSRLKQKKMRIYDLTQSLLHFVADNTKPNEAFKWNNHTLLAEILAYIFALITLHKANKDDITDMKDQERLLIPNVD